jgi:hypothetical protein
MLRSLGHVAHAQGDAGRAAPLLQESLTLAQSVGDKRIMAYCLEDMAGVACGQGHPDLAARLCGAAAALSETIGAQRAPNERATYDRTIAAARAALGGEAFTRHWTAGRAMSLEQAAAEAVQNANVLGSDGDRG